MQTLPASFLDSLETVEGFEKEAFQRVHESGEKVISVRLNPARSFHPVFEDMQPVPWSSHGFYLRSRPSFTLDPAFHAGAYYVQEASGMFIEQCLKQCADLSAPVRVLDLCGAPGGKSTLIQSLISAQSLLVSNEVIKTRVNVLAENLSKWGGMNQVVTSNDPKDFGRLQSYFDVMVVDAPCSGSGLFRRDPEAINEWSLQNVKTCSQRQQRILHDAYPALKKDGTLIYSTCSYSAEENEMICDWLIEQFGLESLKIPIRAEWGIVETKSPVQMAAGYRFFPNRLRGEGFFVACFRKKEGEAKAGRYPKKRHIALTPPQKTIAEKWIKHDPAIALLNVNEDALAFPLAMIEDLNLLVDNLYLKKAGVRVGRMLKDDLIPAHELALSTIVRADLPSILLKCEQALQYLRKEDVTLETKDRGWFLIQSGGLNLGWVKQLGNRTNNYYPADWRIQKSSSN